MATVADCLNKAALIVASTTVESDSARLDVELLLAKVLDKPRSFFFTWPEHELSPEQQAQFELLLERRLEGEPVSYILGEQDFWSLNLLVSPATLIPRPDTELLVELALERCFDEAHILDLGTGTGAIALALASEFPAAKIEAVDLHEPAVALAQKNAQRLGFSNTRIYQSAWFDNVSACFDVIVSNPPYIEEGDKHLAEGDVRFEPESALVSGADGLNDIRLIVDAAPSYLFDGGWLLLEHGWDQAERVRLLLLKKGFDQVQSHRDLGGNERITLAQWQGS